MAGLPSKQGDYSAGPGQHVFKGTLYPAEKGTIIRKKLNPSWQSYLAHSRTALIAEIERNARQVGWNRRLYESYARVVQIERGLQLPKWHDELLEEKEWEDASDDSNTTQVDFEEHRPDFAGVGVNPVRSTVGEDNKMEEMRLGEGDSGLVERSTCEELGKEEFIDIMEEHLDQVAGPFGAGLDANEMANVILSTELEDLQKSLASAQSYISGEDTADQIELDDDFVKVDTPVTENKMMYGKS
ncbi:hypothetical protein H2198_003093 [Neophaeococcomyces mojaviensis]|uniref:Uncharacterized protein n=1 Tax=Neophaeococcomyces mojaviensis TaxID=3383035 RepID=A0ACC3ACU9_9EURO|nr:hypothetical protein H2198_003093 [Knufia sp. JES_112]